jgi:GTPase SAR1 family protein
LFSSFSADISAESNQELPLGIPQEVIKGGWIKVFQYWRQGDLVDLLQCRVMVVGNKEVGKTSLIRALRSEDGRALHVSHRTQGIEVDVLPLTFEDSQLVCSLWDFAGQEIYYLSHTVHFSRRCIFCLVWSHVYTNTDDGTSIRELDLEEKILPPLFTWLQMLAHYVPNAQIVLIGSHSQLNMSLFSSTSAKVQARMKEEVERLNLCLHREREALHVTLKQLRDDKRCCLEECVSQGLCDEFGHDSDLLSFCKQTPFTNNSMLFALRELVLKYDEVRCRLCTLSGRFDFSDPLEDDKTSQLQMNCFVALDSRSDPDSIRRFKNDLKEVVMSMSFIRQESKVPKWYREALGFVHQLEKTEPDAALSKKYKLGSAFIARRKIASVVQSQLLQSEFPRQKSEQEIWDCLSFWSDLGETFVYDCPIFYLFFNTKACILGTRSCFYATRCL